MQTIISQHLGELSALLTAVCWTFTSMAFEAAGKRVGSKAVNLIRLVMAFFLLGTLAWVRSRQFLPTGFESENWFWLSLSGLIGFVIGDLFLFQAFVLVGARISMLIMSLTPPLTALFGWIILGEVLTAYHSLGMLITVMGIALVVLGRPRAQKKVVVRYPLKGILLAFGGAAGQGLGLVLSKMGMADHDAFAATQVRVIAGIVGFSVLYLLTGHWSLVIKAFYDKKALSRIAIGATFGPFLGVSFSLLAVQHTTAAVAATIMAIVPVLIIPPAIMLFNEKVSFKEVVGASIAVAGVVVLFMG
jgi:drug/metabolite transporter (DMT)-like permease